MNNIFKGIVVVFFMSILPLKSKAQINWNMPPNVHNERYIGDSYATKRPALTFNGFTGKDASKGYSLQKISFPSFPKSLWERQSGSSASITKTYQIFNFSNRRLHFINHWTKVSNPPIPAGCWKRDGKSLLNRKL